MRVGTSDYRVQGVTTTETDNRVSVSESVNRDNRGSVAASPFGVGCWPEQPRPRATTDIRL